MAKITEVVKSLAEDAEKKYDCSLFDIEYKNYKAATNDARRDFCLAAVFLC